jgi:hypothetical protein
MNENAIDMGTEIKLGHHSSKCVLRYVEHLTNERNVPMKLIRKNCTQQIRNKKQFTFCNHYAEKLLKFTTALDDVNHFQTQTSNIWSNI